MRTRFEVLIAKLFNNPLGRWYLGVPKGKRIYKITKSSAHYYTGDIAKTGMPVICTGEAFPSGLRLFNKFSIAGQFVGIISVIALTKFVGEHGLLPLFALSDTGAKFPASNESAGGTQFTNPQNVYADDGSYATGTFQNNNNFYNFSFGISTGATIDGYEIKVEGHYTHDGTRVASYDPMEIFVGATDKGLIGGSTNLDLDTDSIKTFGGPTSLPSTPPTVAEVNDNTSSGFKVRIQTTNSGGTGTVATFIDYLTVKIYYTDPPVSISVNDAITVSESVSIDLVNNIVVNDAITVTESVTIVIKELVLSVNEAITVSESINLDVKNQLNVNDSVTVSDVTFLSFPLLETLVDSFDDSSTDPTKWTANTGGTTTIAETSAVTVTFPAAATSSDFGEYRSTQKFNLTASYGYLEVSQIPNNVTGVYSYYKLYLDANNHIEWITSGTSLIARKVDGGVSTDLVTLTYDSSVHVWWRIRESGGTIFFDTSFDIQDADWVNRATTTLSHDITQYQVRIGASCDQVVILPGTFTFDDFNYAVLFINKNESITISESILVDQFNSISVNDAIAVTDVLTVAILNLGNISVNDSVTVSESVSTQIPLLGNINVNESILDVEDVVILINLSDLLVNDTVAVSENVTVGLISDNNVNDAITVSEDLSLDRLLNISVNEAITVSESVTGFPIVDMSPGTPVGVGDRIYNSIPTTRSYS